MTLLIAGFLLILLLTFSCFFIATRPSSSERTVFDRLLSIPKTGEGASALVKSSLLLKTEGDSHLMWVEHLLVPYRLSRRLRILILQAHSSASVAGIIMTSVGTGIALLAIVYLFFPLIPVAAVAFTAGATVPYIVLRVLRDRRMAAFNKALPDCIDMMGRALRAGHSIVAAIEMVADQSVEPAGSEFAEVFKQQNYGLPLREALERMIERVPSQDLRVLVTGILVQRETGGNLAEILDRTAEVIRERLRIYGEIRTQTAQGRMTGWILGSLPIGMLILINITDPGYSRVLFEDPTGRKLLYLGMALLGVGGLIIRKIVNGIEV